MNSLASPWDKVCLLYFVCSVFPFVCGILFASSTDDIVSNVDNVSSSEDLDCQAVRICFSVSNIVMFAFKVYIVVYFFLRRNLQDCLAKYSLRREQALKSGKYDAIDYCGEPLLALPIHCERIPFWTLATNVLIRLCSCLFGLSIVSFYLISQVNILFATCHWSSTFGSLAIISGSFEFIMAGLLTIFVSIYAVFEDDKSSPNEANGGREPAG